MQTTLEVVRKITADQMGLAIGEITDESRFIEDLGMDSLDRVALSMDLEEQFNIFVEDEAADVILGRTVAFCALCVDEAKRAGVRRLHEDFANGLAAGQKA